MKNIISIIALVLLSFTMKAQDTLKLKNGTKVLGAVTEVSSSEVKFRKTADGPIYVMHKDEIASISYQNGMEEVFDNTSSSSSSSSNTNSGSSNSSANNESKKIGNYNGNDEGFTTGKKHYGGPRIGMTAISDGTISKSIGTNVISQFGWQFETRFFTVDNGSSGLFEFVPMLGGLERGAFLPSASALIGFRTGSGYEIGCGPNLSRSGFGMVFAGGASFQMGHVCFPVNIAFQPNISKSYTSASYDYVTGQYTEHTQKLNSGFRLSLLIGFNARSN
ncbi:MAG: hypothetical protein HY064_16740 [Bacteroidetes bacterium]|nr:hypothetical protein [Bacteroidota bacterium]